MIRHIVMFQLAATDPAEKDAQAAEAKARLEALVGVVPGLRAMEVSRNGVDLAGNMDFALVADFDDAAALEGYIVHPAHEEVAAYIGSIRSGRAAIDVIV